MGGGQPAIRPRLARPQATGDGLWRCLIPEPFYDETGNHANGVECHGHRRQDPPPMRDDTRKWIDADFRHCWHPFTRQGEWCQPGNEPVVITRGEGAWLVDSEGRRYFDGNSSIWTNIHGHGHPVLVAAVRDQLDEIAHCSFLGFTHPLATELAAKLCELFPCGTLERAFFSDDGSTAIECALKMALQYRQLTGNPRRKTFVAFANGYHGDTLGAASLGGVGRFFDRFQDHGYAVRHVSNVGELALLDPGEIAGCVIEPLVQGVNEMRQWPAGMLRTLREWCTEHDVHLILDEVMTGFGRTGTMFACEHEQVVPDFLCLAKGLTGGLLPMAATLTTGDIYHAFLGDASRAFYYGHSYTANPLGCAAALASLRVFEKNAVLASLAGKISFMNDALARLAKSENLVFEVRQTGLVAGIELRRADGSRFSTEERFGEKVCRAARRHGLLTRPILDTLVLMPPLCATTAEIGHAVSAISAAIADSRY